jgi:hypothetical protein
MACKHGYISYVNNIINNCKEAKINEKDDEGWTAFSLACHYGHKEIINTMMKHKDFDRLNLLNEQNNFIANAMTFIRMYFIMHSKCPFLCACYSESNNNLEIIELLLRQKNIIVPENIDYKKIKQNKEEIINLIELFKQNPTKIRNSLTLKYHMPIYLDILLLCNNNYVIRDSKTKNRVSRQKRAIRFFKLVIKLPLELQMIVKIVYNLLNQ